ASPKARSATWRATSGEEEGGATVSSTSSVPCRGTGALLLGRGRTQQAARPARMHLAATVCSAVSADTYYSTTIVSNRIQSHTVLQCRVDSNSRLWCRVLSRNPPGSRKPGQRRV